MHIIKYEPLLHLVTIIATAAVAATATATATVADDNNEDDNNNNQFLTLLTLQRGVPTMARCDLNISWHGVENWSHVTVLFDFSFHLSNAYEAIAFGPLQPRR
jgi:hypothetical protein